MKESKLPKRFWLIIAVAMILVSMIGSNLVQSDGGKVKIHKVNLVVADGAELYAQMYIPEQMRDWAAIMGIEYVHIDKDTTQEKLEQQLVLQDIAWKLR